MNKILNLGRWIFPMTFFLYVGLHFGQPEVGANFVPSWFYYPLFWNYFTGICILAFIISAIIRKYDKLAAVMMALYVLLIIALVHIPRAGESEMEMINIFRNIMVIGALLIYAKYVAKDSRVIGE
jgi:uncharacterized membrane protein